MTNSWEIIKAINSIAAPIKLMVKVEFIGIFIPLAP